MNTTIAQALAAAQGQGLARIDAQMLLLHALGRSPYDRAWLIAHDGDPLPADAQAHFAALGARRLQGEPVAYLTGHREFYGLPLRVDARVLDPRPDTETLVDWALAVAVGLKAPHIADLGTGSGAIALALKARRPDATVTALDASSAALDVARGNAERLRLPIRLRQGDWLSGQDERYDLIVSNPPYIAEDDSHLPSLRHEPRMALASGPDGLADIRTLIAQAPSHLSPGGWLLLEHGWNQAEAVQALLRAAGFAQVQSRHDLAGTARCTGGQWAGSSPAPNGPADAA